MASKHEKRELEILRSKFTEGLIYQFNREEPISFWFNDTGTKSKKPLVKGEYILFLDIQLSPMGLRRYRVNMLRAGGGEVGYVTLLYYEVSTCFDPTPKE
jgi:hypothetical protein